MLSNIPVQSFAVEEVSWINGINTKYIPTCEQADEDEKSLPKDPQEYDLYDHAVSIRKRIESHLDGLEDHAYTLVFLMISLVVWLVLTTFFVLYVSFFGFSKVGHLFTMTAFLAFTGAWLISQRRYFIQGIYDMDFQMVLLANTFNQESKQHGIQVSYQSPSFKIKAGSFSLEVLRPGGGLI